MLSRSPGKLAERVEHGSWRPPCTHWRPRVSAGSAVDVRRSAFQPLLGCGFWSYLAHRSSTLSRLSRALSRLALTLSCDDVRVCVVKQR